MSKGTRAIQRDDVHSLEPDEEIFPLQQRASVPIAQLVDAEHATREDHGDGQQLGRPRPGPRLSCGVVVTAVVRGERQQQAGAAGARPARSAQAVQKTASVATCRASPASAMRRPSWRRAEDVAERAPADALQEERD